MSANHIRGISTTLGLLDKALCEFDQLANGHEIRSVLYQVLNPLSQAQRELMAAEVSNMKKMLEEMRDALNLEVTVRSADKMVTSSCSVLWTYLVELESHHLRRYGTLPPGLGEYVDPRMKTLSESMQRIAAIVAGTGPRCSAIE